MRFMASDFEPTEFEQKRTKEGHRDKQKHDFANMFVIFVESGFKWSKFPKWFYNQLSMCFGHIAHHDKHGFYHHWFKTPGGRHKFIEHTLNAPCYGHVTHTYCDVELALQQWIKDNQDVVENAIKVDFFWLRNL